MASLAGGWAVPARYTSRVNLSRRIYRLLARCVAPLAYRRLRRRSDPDRAPERLGRVPDAGGEIWMHAASAGEVNACAPLARALLDRDRQCRLVISTLTGTGAQRVSALFADTPRVRHVFAPLDTPVAVAAWLDRTRPLLGIVVETELWPELFAACRSREIALVLVNARISERAFRRYRRLKGLFGPALGAVAAAMCQTHKDADRLAALGLPEGRVRITGNLKFDFQPPPDLDARARSLHDRWDSRPVWVAGSTHPGEEEIVLAAHRKVLERYPEALLVLVPRHPERAVGVMRRARRAGLNPVTGEGADLRHQSVMVIDRMGVLLACYQAGQIAFVGGSLVAGIGGHNLLEPALCGKPVLTGPHLSEQQRMHDELTEAGALRRVVDAESLADAVIALLADPARALAMGSAGRARIHAGRGALERTLEAIAPWLNANPA